MRNYERWTPLRWGMLLAFSAWLALALPFTCSSKDQAVEPCSAITGVDEGHLNAAYQSFNADFFNENLPTDTYVKFQPPNGATAQGETTWESGHYVIYVNPMYVRDGREGYQTLFHEMCHIQEWGTDAENDDHGKHWQGCMMRLAHAGAFEFIW